MPGRCLERRDPPASAGGCGDSRGRSPPVPPDTCGPAGGFPRTRSGDSQASRRGDERERSSLPCVTPPRRGAGQQLGLRLGALGPTLHHKGALSGAGKREREGGGECRGEVRGRVVCHGDISSGWTPFPSSEPPQEHTAQRLSGLFWMEEGHATWARGGGGSPAPLSLRGIHGGSGPHSAG